MKKTKLILMIMCVVISMLIIMTGCIEEYGGTLDEPEITLEYLKGEYARQLLRDGAYVLFGTIDLRRASEDEIIVIIREKEIVNDPYFENGVYIADKNLESEYLLSHGVRATFHMRDENIFVPMEHDEFIDVVWVDFFETIAEDPNGQDYRLYHIYIIEGYVELLIARELP